MINTTDLKLTPQSLQCGHCSNEAPMFIICEGKLTHYFSPGQKSNIDEYEDYEEGYRLRWQILICSSCEEMNLFQQSSLSLDDYEYTDFQGTERWRESIILEQLYPSRKRFQNLPNSVEKSYKIALRLLPIEPVAFAVFAGRTLEFLCRDREAKGKTLEKMLNDLAGRGEIPSILAEMAQSLRFFRNIGAHASEIKISKNDALVLRDLCDAILEYVYEAPSMLQKVQERIEELKRGNR